MAPRQRAQHRYQVRRLVPPPPACPPPTPRTRPPSQSARASRPRRSDSRRPRAESPCAVAACCLVTPHSVVLSLVRRPRHVPTTTQTAAAAAAAAARIWVWRWVALAQPCALTRSLRARSTARARSRARTCRHHEGRVGLDHGLRQRDERHQLPQPHPTLQSPDRPRPPPSHPRSRQSPRNAAETSRQPARSLWTRIAGPRDAAACLGVADAPREADHEAPAHVLDQLRSPPGEAVHAHPEPPNRSAPHPGQ